MAIRLLLLFTILIIISCDNKDSRKDSDHISSTNQTWDIDSITKKAWETHNLSELISIIKSLDDTLLSDTMFFSAILTISDLSNFDYGLYDLNNDNHWYRYSKKTQYLIRHNITKAYVAFMLSNCPFQNKRPKDLTFIQDSIWSYTNKLSEEEFKKIQDIVNMTCY